jgi:hypothetical protein
VVRVLAGLQASLDASRRSTAGDPVGAHAAP